jgi:hypothetical protein
MNQFYGNLGNNSYFMGDNLSKKTVWQLINNNHDTHCEKCKDKCRKKLYCSRTQAKNPVDSIKNMEKLISG